MGRDFVGDIVDLVRIHHIEILTLSSSKGVMPVSSSVPVAIAGITPENTGLMGDFRGPEFGRKFQEFLRVGDLGVYALDGGKAVAHLWAKTYSRENEDIEGYFRLREGEAIIHYGFVDEKYRGKNIFPLMLTVLCTKLFGERNISLIYVFVERENIPSLRGLRKVGFAVSRERLYFPLYQKLKARLNAVRAPKVSPRP